MIDYEKLKFAHYLAVLNGVSIDVHYRVYLNGLMEATFNVHDGDEWLPFNDIDLFIKKIDELKWKHANKEYYQKWNTSYATF